MNALTNLDADPIASFALAIRDRSYTTYSELFTDEQWQEAGQFYSDDGLNAREQLALMMAQDKARAEYDSIAWAYEQRARKEWQDNFDDWFAHQGVRSVAGMVSA